MSVQQGFKAEDNVVTVMSLGARIKDSTSTGDTAEAHLKWLEYLFTITLAVNPAMWIRPKKVVVVVITPVVAQILVDAGYSKETLASRFFENARITAAEWDRLQWLKGGALAGAEFLDDSCESGEMEKEVFCATPDPDRLVPLVRSTKEIMVIVTGDPGRNRITMWFNNHIQGYPVSMKIELPKNWDTLLAEAKQQ